MQTHRGFLAERAGDSIRTQASSVERLVGVDVADARDRALVEQNGLQRCAPFAQAPVELAGRELWIDRLRAEQGHLLGRQQRFLRPQKKASKTSRVAIAQLPPVI